MRCYRVSSTCSKVLRKLQDGPTYKKRMIDDGPHQNRVVNIILGVTREVLEEDHVRPCTMVDKMVLS